MPTLNILDPSTAPTQESVATRLGQGSLELWEQSYPSGDRYVPIEHAPIGHLLCTTQGHGAPSWFIGQGDMLNMVRDKSGVFQSQDPVAVFSSAVTEGGEAMEELVKRRALMALTKEFVRGAIMEHSLESGIRGARLMVDTNAGWRIFFSPSKMVCPSASASASGNGSSEDPDGARASDLDEWVTVTAAEAASIGTDVDCVDTIAEPDTDIAATAGTAGVGADTNANTTAAATAAAASVARAVPADGHVDVDVVPRLLVWEGPLY